MHVEAHMRSLGVVEVEILWDGLLVRFQCLGNSLKTLFLNGAIEAFQMSILRRTTDMDVSVCNGMGKDLFAEVFGEL